MSAVDRCVAEVVAEGTVDWVSSHEVAGIATDTGNAISGEENRRLCIQVIGELIRRGLVEVGDLDAAQKGFRRWDLTEEETLARIEREWPATTSGPLSPDFCWLRNTKRGHALARRGGPR